MKIIDLEAHYNIQEYIEFLHEKGYAITGRGGRPNAKLIDLGEERLKAMDAAGIDVQVLIQAGSVQFIEPSDGITWSKKVNDKLSEAVNKYPDRFVGLASIAAQSPDEAARELERAVMELGLKGAVLKSHARDEYLDKKKYWVIFEMAEKLDVPLYIHPVRPAKAMLKPYIEDYDLSGPPLGYSADAALHSLRLIFSGLFDKYHGLKIILGHMGEGLPFWLPRLDFFWTEPHKREQAIAKKPSEYIKSNFFITTSGMCFQPALICSYLGLGADRIMFGVDYPYEQTDLAVKFMNEAPICDSDKEKICHLNAERLFKLE